MQQAECTSVNIETKAKHLQRVLMANAAVGFHNAKNFFQERWQTQALAYLVKHDSQSQTNGQGILAIITTTINITMNIPTNL